MVVAMDQVKGLNTEWTRTMLWFWRPRCPDAALRPVRHGGSSVKGPSCTVFWVLKPPVHLKLNQWKCIIETLKSSLLYQEVTLYQTLFHSGIAHLLPVAFGLSDPAASLRSRSRLAGTITKVGGSTGDTDRLCPYFGHILSVSIVFFVIPHVMRRMSFRNQLCQRTHCWTKLAATTKVKLYETVCPLLVKGETPQFDIWSNSCHVEQKKKKQRSHMIGNWTQ